MIGHPTDVYAAPNDVPSNTQCCSHGGSQSRQTLRFGHESRGTRNQETLCRRGPAEIYWTGPEGALMYVTLFLSSKFMYPPRKYDVIKAKLSLCLISSSLCHEGM
jgi:hypothetical protein